MSPLAAATTSAPSPAPVASSDSSDAGAPASVAGSGASPATTGPVQAVAPARGPLPADAVAAVGARNVNGDGLLALRPAGRQHLLY